MSLKHKNEAAFLSVIEDAGLFTGQRLTSEENQVTTMAKPFVVAVARQANSRPGSAGEPTGQDTWIVDVVLRSKADKQPDDTVEPETTHQENVDAIKASLIVTDLKAQLTAAQDAYSVLHVMPIPPGDATPDPKDREFREVWSFRVVCVEADCD